MATEERTSVVCPDGQIPWNSRSEPVILNRCCESSTSEWSRPWVLIDKKTADMIKEISEIIAGTEGLVIAEYRGLTVDAATKLRKEARENGVQLRVLKNTLARRAVKDTPFEGLSDQFVGPLLYGFSADPVAPAKVMANFAKTNPQLVIKAGAMPNNVLDVAGVEKARHNAEPR